tara:strand:+ start:18804 stop:20444 length:1641 start_codon:yes stop_codon:yes gene_type:complete
MNTNKSLEFDIEYLDLRRIMDILWRKKFVLIPTTGLIVIFSIIYAFSIKKTWQGQFQIVMSKNNNPVSISKLNPALNDLIPGGNNNKLFTEVEILKSPSVLLPVFNFVKLEKAKKLPQEKIFFYKWRTDNLKIDLEKGTSVLNISYIDQDKEFILKTLNKLSKAYQDYSEKDRKNQLDRGIKYLDKQVEIYEDKNSKSLATLQGFAIENDLSYKVNLEEKLIEISSEKERIRLSNELRNIKEQIKKIENNEINEDMLTFYSEFLGNNYLIDSIKKLEKELSLDTLKYQKNDKQIVLKRNRIILLKNEMKNQLISSLNSRKVFLNANLNASKRDKDVLLKFRNYINNSLQNNETLNRLKDDREFLLLEKAKFNEPWELITKPTLGRFPIAPRKKIYAFLGLIIGGVFGSAISLFIDKKEGFIFYKNDISNILNIKLILDLSEKKSNQFSNLFKLLLNGPTFPEDFRSLALIPVGNIENDKLDLFEKITPEIKKQKTIKIVSNIVDSGNYDIQVLVVQKGFSKKEDLIKINNQISLNGNKIDGWIFLS